MRFFPSAARRRVGAVVAACSLALGAIAVPLAHANLSAADDLEHKQKRVQKHIDQADDHLEMSSARLIRATQRLGAARTDLSAARDTLGSARTELADARVLDLEMQARLTLAEADLEVARLAVISGTAAVGRQRDSVASVISSIYTEGDPELLAFAALLDARTPGDLIRQEGVRDVIVGRETRAYDDLSAAEVLLEVQESQVEDAKREVATKARDAAVHVVTLQDLETDAQAAKDEVVRLVADRKDASAEAKAAKASDRKELAKLEKEDRRIEKKLVEIARKARLRALREARLRALREARRQGRQQLSSGPSTGFLAWPSVGEVTSSYGMRNHPIFGYYSLHDGTDFGAACGTPLYAASDGRVISQDFQTAYGNRLILDHGFQRGVGLATIYNHAASYTVGVGDQVSRGQVIGYVGSTGWSTGCHLHFTVMANGQAVDPMNWL